MHVQYGNEWDDAYRELGGEGRPFKEALAGGAGPGAAGRRGGPSGEMLGGVAERSPNGQGAAPTVARSLMRDSGGRGGWLGGPRAAALVLDASDRNLMAVSITGGKFLY